MLNINTNLPSNASATNDIEAAVEQAKQAEAPTMPVKKRAKRRANTAKKVAGKKVAAKRKQAKSAMKPKKNKQNQYFHKSDKVGDIDKTANAATYVQHCRIGATVERCRELIMENGIDKKTGKKGLPGGRRYIRAAFLKGTIQIVPADKYESYKAAKKAGDKAKMKRLAR